ncbi:hypothetical protein ABEB36_014560 [Hypothenemus hampei]|uniref:Uncharacterized protein n=1 Tax=Hypothenemus hampei TaxID=57062 RepID=A0ABD1E314_HYPHA
MIKIYYACNRNAQLSSERYLQENPDRHQPHMSYFSRLDSNLAEFGSFIKPRRKYGIRLNPESEEAIINRGLKKMLIFANAGAFFD